MTQSPQLVLETLLVFETLPIRHIKLFCIQTALRNTFTFLFVETVYALAYFCTVQTVDLELEDTVSNSGIPGKLIPGLYWRVGFY